MNMTRRRRSIEGTDSPGLMKRRRNSVDVEEGHRGGRLGSSRECDAEEHVSRDWDQTNREVQEWKRVQGTRRENIKNNGQQVMSVNTLEGFVRKSTWQVADVRRPLVSASHIIPWRTERWDSMTGAHN